LLLLLFPLFARAQEEEHPVFQSPPELPASHPLPLEQVVFASPWWMTYVDVAALLVALTLAALFSLKWRSRKALFALAVASALYFGFYRHGCVCSVGSIQNVALALFNHQYALPAGVAVFFLAPLVFALFAGRAFCAGVCPLGALQDILLIKAIKVPHWLQSALGVLPFIYLGAAVLYVAANIAFPVFLICQYDPIIPFYRQSGPEFMMIAGGMLLVLGMFVGRPYCRFLCPYGALLRLVAPLSKWKVQVTPTDCIHCRLCEDACPYGAIRVPTQPPAEGKRHVGKSRLAMLIGLTPVLIALGCLLGLRGGLTFSDLDPSVRVVRIVEAWPAQLAAAKAQLVADNKNPDDPKLLPAEPFEFKAFNSNAKLKVQFYGRAAATQRRYPVSGLLFGGFVGLVIGLTLIGHAVRRRRTQYEPDPALCVSCGRCFSSCPQAYRQTEVSKDE
jgi:ferredoxin